MKELEEEAEKASYWLWLPEEREQLGANAPIKAATGGGRETSLICHCLPAGRFTGKGGERLLNGGYKLTILQLA